MLSLFVPAFLALVWWSASAGPKAVAVILTLPIGVAILMWSLVANQPLTGMSEYFTGLNTELIAGYSEAMILPASIDRLVLLGEFIIGCAAIGFLLRTSGLPQGTTRSERWVPAIFLILIGWGIFKSSFVFASKNHTLAAAMISLATLVVVAGIACRNNRITKQKLSSPGPIIVLLLGLIATSNMGLRSNYKPRLNAASTTLASTKETVMTLISPAKREQLSINRQKLLREISAQHGPLVCRPGNNS
jgi:hypothetical protein